MRDVQGLPPRDLLLVLERGDELLRLRLSAHADGPRLHLQHGRVQAHSGPQGPFFQACSQALAGALLARLVHVRADRICRLEFRETHDGGRAALLAELTGRRANLVLLDGGGRVLDLLVVAPARKDGRPPRLRVGEAWDPPPGRPPMDPGPTLREAFPTPTEPAPGLQSAPLSWRVQFSLGTAVDAAQSRREARKLEARIERRLQRARALVEGLEQRSVAADEVPRLRQDGELLKAALDALQPGQEEVSLPDWYSEGAPPRVISLDPRKSPQDNLERLFARARKLERGAADLERELASARARIAELDALLERLRGLDASPEALEREAVDAGLLEPAQTAPGGRRLQPAARLPYRRYQGLHGGEIRVGRSARDNDALTLRHSRGNDLWLHTADAPGSHVVLRLERGAEAHPEEVLDAGHLAVHFSPLRDARSADVHVAPRKAVHKPRGAKPGLVQLSGGRVLAVRMQPDRLRRLLSPARAGQERPGTEVP